MIGRVSLAHQALMEITPASTVGFLISETTGDDGVVTILFEATMAGYPGWHWTVSVAELEGEAPTVLEAELLPGDGALLAPDWVPWSDRLTAGDSEESEDDDESDEDDDDSADEDDDDDSDDDDSDDDEESDDDTDDDSHGEDFGDDVYDGLDPESALADADDASDEDARS